MHEFWVAFKRFSIFSSDETVDKWHFQCEKSAEFSLNAVRATVCVRARMCVDWMEKRNVSFGLWNEWKWTHRERIPVSRHDEIVAFESESHCRIVVCALWGDRDKVGIAVKSSFIRLFGFIVMTFYLYSFAFASVHWAKLVFHRIHNHLLFLLFLTLFCLSFTRALALSPSLSPPKWNYSDDFVCFFGNFRSVPSSSFIIIISIYEGTFLFHSHLSFSQLNAVYTDFIGIFNCWASGRFLVPVNY